MRWAVALAALGTLTVVEAQGTPTYTNSIGMAFVLIKPGTVVIGRFQPPYPKPVDPSASQPGRSGGGRGSPLTPEEYKKIEEIAKADYRPGFEVRIDRPFYIGQFEVTQAQWTRVMGANPSTFQGSKVTGPSDDLPVETVTWADAQAFIKKLNAMEKTSVYRLPTEFEWEYAARAGAEDDIPWADIRQQAYNSGPTPQAVGKMKPNAWGLHDMLGNVWEWVQDAYNEKVFADPTPPRQGREHVLKGGGFLADVKNMTYLTHAAGPGSQFDVGFRVVREALR
jgi:sulfatase modifying factor 1